MAWWNELSTAQQVLWAIGTFASVLLVLQMGLSFAGFEHTTPDLTAEAPDGAAGTAHSHDFHTAGGGHHLTLLQFFTIRDAVAFLTGLGWGSLMLIGWGLPEWLAVIGGIVQGLGFAAVVMLLMWFLSSLASSGSISLKNAINQQGEVTLAIPAHGSGYGKMMLSIQGRSIEIEAYTPGEAIPRGARVRVIRVQGGDMLFVEPIVAATG